MIDTEAAPSQLPSIPEELSSSQAKLVYLYLQIDDSATIDDVSETLAMKKIAVLSVLDSLSSYGVIEQTGDGYVPTS